MYVAVRIAPNRRTKLFDGTPSCICEPSSIPVNVELRFRSPVLDNSSKLIIAILHDSHLVGLDKCLGKIDIELGHLLELQYAQQNEGK